MRNRIKIFIRNCNVRQQNKVEQVLPTGLLQPLPIPAQKWEDIATDFIEGLSHSHGKSTILVVVDRLLKYAHFITISHSYTVVGIAHVYLIAWYASFYYV